MFPSIALGVGLMAVAFVTYWRTKSYIYAAVNLGMVTVTYVLVAFLCLMGGNGALADAALKPLYWLYVTTDASPAEFVLYLIVSPLSLLFTASLTYHAIHGTYESVVQRCNRYRLGKFIEACDFKTFHERGDFTIDQHPDLKEAFDRYQSEDH